MKLASIVEGHGEVKAVPLLLRRLVAQLAPDSNIEVLPSHRVPRSKVVKDGELERTVELQARRVGADGAILILLDADDDCIATLAPALLRRASARRPDRKIAVALANREFEAWFLCGIASLCEHLIPAPEQVPDPELVRSPKGWLERNLRDGYVASVDQARLTARLDVTQARRAPSFDKLLRDVSMLLGMLAP